LEKSLNAEIIFDLEAQSERKGLIQFDADCTPGIHSIHNLQAREAGKAVRFGRGPATVIG